MTIEIEPQDIDDIAFKVCARDAYTGQIIGSAFCGSDPARRVVTLDTIQVNPPYRHQGVGSSILSSVVDHAKAKGALELVGAVKPEYGSRFEETCRFYEKHGATVDSNGEFRVDLSLVNL